MKSVQSFFTKTTLSIAVVTLLAACGGDDKSSHNQNNPLPQDSSTDITVTEGHSQQVLPVAPEDEVKIATYAMTHDLSYADKLVNDYMVEGNIISLPNTNYQVGDTIEFQNTIIKIDSIVADGQYAIVPAGLFDVFSELEIDTSMVMGSEDELQVGAVSAQDLLNAGDKIDDIYQDLEKRNCLPSTRKNITVHGVAGNHKMPYHDGKYNGIEIGLKDCKLYESDNSSITTDQNLSVGMTARMMISKASQKALFQIDGASLLNGKLDIDFDNTENINIRLATYKPGILKGLEASKIETLEKLIRAQIFLNLKTLISGSLKGTTGVQVPTDFAMGVSAKYDERNKEWSVNEYKLNNNKNVALDKDTMGINYDVEVMRMKLGSALEAGYVFNLEAESPWFEEDENEERNWFQKKMQEFKDYNEPLLTGDLAIRSNGSVSAGLLLDVNAGSKVEVKDCRADYRGVIGAYNFNSFLARAGSGLIMYPKPPQSSILIQRHVFNNPITLFKFDMFNIPNEKKENWCGPTSKLQGFIGTKYRKILVSDAQGNPLITSEYIIDWDNSLHQAGLFQVGATISETDQLWQNLQNFATPTEVAQEFTLPTEVPEGLLNLSFDDDSTKYSMDDEGWVFAWKTFNPGVTITNDRSRTPGFAINCEGNCTDDPILLVVKSPDNKYAYLQFKPTFAEAIAVKATAKATQNDLVLSAEANYSGATYTWKTSDGKVLISQKPELTVPSASEFATQALIDGKVTLVTEALGQESTIGVNVESETLSDVEQAVNTMVGYWKSECVSGSHDSSYSKRYYIAFEKESATELNMINNISQNFYNSSNCSGQAEVYSNGGEIINLQDEGVPKFNGKNTFVVDEEDGGESYFRIPQSEYEVLANQIVINNTVPVVTNLKFTPKSGNQNASIQVSFNTNMKNRAYFHGSYSPSNTYWKNGKTYVIEFDSYMPGGTITFSGTDDRDGSKGFQNSSGIAMQQDKTFTFPN